MFSLRYWSFFAIFLAAVGYSVFMYAHNESPIKSPADNNSYRYVELNNGLKVLLVHTPDAKKAAAAVTVKVGSSDDPADRQGLAHFLEHMLFLGTKPYPNAAEYQDYISRNGGSHNAFTAQNQTTYFFDIDNNALEGALDRFAPFFISPTFDAQYVEREKNAVEAEYRAKYRDDFRRIYSAEKQAMNPKHPFAAFSVGSLDTLADRDGKNIRDELIQFYENHYSADRMTLVLAGNYKLSDMERWVKARFSEVPKRNLAPIAQTEPLFSAEQLPLDMNIEPIKEIRRVQFSFPMPENESLYRYKMLSLLSSLIGHEGEGSLLAFFKARGWAEGLSAGLSLSNEQESLLVVQINLTRLGMLHIDHITQALGYYLDLLKAKPLPQYLFTEQADLNELAFRFQEQPELTDLVVRLSGNMLTYPATDIIYGDYRTQTPKAKQLKPFLDALNLNNMLRTVIAPNVTTDTLDPWYDTPIRIRPLAYQADSDFADNLNELHLPKANPFIPTDFSLLPGVKQATPELLIDSPERRLWYYPEHEFVLPKSRVLVSFEREGVQGSAKEQMLAQLYVRTINEALNTYSYPASVAGLNYHLKATQQGLELTLGGYQHKLPVLLQRILEQMQNVDLSEEEFERYQASLTRMLENQLKNKPYERALLELRFWLFEPSFNEQELLHALSSIKREDVLAFAQDLKQKLALQLYVHGSLSKEQAQEFAKVVSQYYSANHPLLPALTVLKAPQGLHQSALNIVHNDKLLLLYVQGLDNSDRERARFALLGQILGSPYYQKLRTEEQLGYVVFASQFPQQTVPGLIFLVQAPKATPEHIWHSSQTFFQNYQETLAKMSAAEFDNFKQGLITLLQEKPQNMSDKFNKNWQEISIGRRHFDTNAAIAAEVAKLTLSDVQALYQQALIQQENPALAFTLGGALTGWKNLNAIKRSELAHFGIKSAHD